jgi:L-2,4-diaminobutyrate decarboxylase
VLTQGGSLANLTALLTARQVRAPFDAWNDGLAGHAQPALAVLVSDQAHYSVDRAVRIMGLGEGGAVSVPCNAAFEMRADALPEALARARASGRHVFAVVASASSTATGAFDPLGEIADFCATNDLWLHVDGAHGASALLSRRHRHLLAGVERADSLAWDTHKLMMMPGAATALLYRDGRHQSCTFAQRASYLYEREGTSEVEWWNAGKRTLECTKRMLSLKIYMALQLLGVAPFREHVERCFARAQELAELVGAAGDFELATPPQANIVCFRYRPPGIDGADLDALQARLRQRVVDEGLFYLVQARLPAGLYLRTTLLYPGTTRDHLVALLEALRRCASSAGSVPATG